ncbi:MAG TPA: hypothetical protein VN795_03800 [Stellaceae bacterium]|jgi:uncharacterized membrane protein YhaH (DUF805 family)|nr:hypothetical protein [Stellaceae bacterium]
MPMMPLLPIWGLLSLMNFIVALAILAIFLVPGVRILRRTGHSGWWVLLWFVPLVNILALWIFAFVHWPALDRGHET